MNKIFFKSGQWFAYEALEKPQPHSDKIETFAGTMYLGGDLGDTKVLRTWEKKCNDAKANALPVLNPEIMNRVIKTTVHTEGDLKIIDWPGTMEKTFNRWVGEHPHDHGYILSLPETTASGDTAKQGEAKTRIEIAGATAEHTRAWNAALEKVNDLFREKLLPIDPTPFNILKIAKAVSEICEEIESLKIKE